MKDYIVVLHNLVNRFVNILLKNIRRFDIFKRLIISFLLVIILPNSIIGIVSLTKFSKEMDNTISDFSYRTLYSLDASISERLIKYKELTNILCRDYELMKLLRKCENLASEEPMNPLEQKLFDTYKSKIGNRLYSAPASSTYSDIVNVEIVSKQNEYVQINYQNNPVGGSISDLDSFRTANYYNRALSAPNSLFWWDTTDEHSTYVVNQYPSVNLGNYITVLKAFPDIVTGEILGVIVINISVPLEDIFTYNNIYLQGGDLILISESGIIQYFNINPFFVKLKTEDISDILSLNTESVAKKIGGKDYLISAVRSKLTGWTLCSVVPRNSLMQQINEIKTIIIQVCLICILIAFLLSYIVTLSISRPLIKLKHSMEKIDETNLEIDYIDNREDEVGILGQKFKSMIERIQNLIKTVYEGELSRKEEMLKRKEAEFDALQMQINPHFLYNTLDIIRWQIIEDKNGESKGSHMLSSFADLLRLGTKRGSNLVTLGEEIDHVKAYIAVVQFDLEYQVHVNYIVSNELSTFKLPKFTLQPLIENIMVHGFKHTIGVGKIEIKAYRLDKELYLSVTDNGEGMTPDSLDTINQTLNSTIEKSKSIGLKNVNERIKLYFGEQYGLEIRSLLGEGTTAVIHLPIII
jgi:sensor histidine kinase YesM